MNRLMLQLFPTFISGAIATPYLFAVAPVQAQLSLDAEAEAEASGGTDESTEASVGANSSTTNDNQETDAEDESGTADADGARSSAAGQGDAGQPKADANANAPKPLPVEFGNLYTFGATAGRIRGIPNGSLIQRRHGLQMDYRKSGLALSGNTWIDTGFRRQLNGLDSEANIDKWLQQGRFVFRATPTMTYGNWFLQGQGEIMARAQMDGDNTIDTDDAWVKFGYWDAFDITFGRFENWEVYHKGLGLERDTLEDQGAKDGVDIYEVNKLFFREDEVGQAAVHAYPTDWLRMEIATALGSKGDFNHIGIRPAVIFDFDYLKVKAAAERRHVSYGYASTGMDQNQQESTDVGVGGTIQGILFPHLEVGVNGATGFRDGLDPFGGLNPRDTWDITSVGAFANVRFGWVHPVVSGLLLGTGVNQTERVTSDCEQSPDGTRTCGTNVHQQAYVVLQHDVFDRATFKVVGGFADADIKVGPSDAAVDRHNQMWDVRARALYWF